MKRKQYRELWRIRFNKMLDLENRSIAAYRSLLDETRKRLGSSPIEPDLEKLIADEKKHARLAEELLKILAAQPD